MNTIPMIGSLAVGVAIGATTAWFFSKKHYEAKAEAHIEAMRKEYVERYEKTKFKYTAIANHNSNELTKRLEAQILFRRKIRWLAKELVMRENIAPENQAKMIAYYEQDTDFDAQGNPIWPDPIEVVRKDYISDTMKGDDRMPKITPFDWSTVGMNVDVHAADKANDAVDNETDISSFVDHEEDDDGDEDPDLSEIERNEHDEEPYVISREEFDEEDEYDSYGLTYYDVDGILTEADGDTLVEDESRIVGNALDHFGEKSHDKDTVYVMTPGTETKYEVIRIHGSYSEYVLGIKEPRKNKAPLKMRRYDE